MDYLLKANGLVIILFLFYTFFLKNETFFKSIRSYFLIGLLLVVAIPLIEIPIYAEQVVTKLNSLNYSDLSLENYKNKQNSINWIQLGSLIYILGVGVFSLKFLIQLISLDNLLSKYKLKKQGNYYFAETSKNISPFSFFNIIIYNKTQFTIEELEQIINHEKAHVLQWHSIDTLLAHLMVITLWFNPFVWLYKKAVQQNLEFLADEYALNLAQNHQLYQFTLLKTCSKKYCTSITNNFYNSLIKKRILMLQKNRSTKKSQWKYTLLLPILVAFILSFNTKIVAQEKKLTEVEEIDKLKVELIIDKNSTEENLKKETAFFKKQFDVEISFKGIKRNSKNEITAVKIEAKSNNSTTKFENSGNNPIKPIKITYDSKNQTTSIGNVKELNEKHFTYKIKKGDDLNFKSKSAKGTSYIFMSSDGKKTTWTSSDTLKMNGNKIIWNKENDNQVKFEVIEEDNTKREHTIKVNNTIFISDDGEKTEIILDEDNASENVYIIKTDETKGEKHKIIKTDSKITIKTGYEKPIYILNGKEITSKEMEAINPDTIESINVFKGDIATKKYGEKGENGILEITTKKD